MRIEFVSWIQASMSRSMLSFISTNYQIYTYSTINLHLPHTYFTELHGSPAKYLYVLGIPTTRSFPDFTYTITLFAITTFHVNWIWRFLFGWLNSLLFNGVLYIMLASSLIFITENQQIFTDFRFQKLYFFRRILITFLLDQICKICLASNRLQSSTHFGTALNITCSTVDFVLFTCNNWYITLTSIHRHSIFIIHLMA